MVAQSVVTPTVTETDPTEAETGPRDQWWAVKVYCSKAFNGRTIQKDC